MYENSCCLQVAHLYQWLYFSIYVIKSKTYMKQQRNADIDWCSLSLWHLHMYAYKWMRHSYVLFLQVGLSRISFTNCNGCSMFTHSQSSWTVCAPPGTFFEKELSNVLGGKRKTPREFFWVRENLIIIIIILILEHSCLATPPPSTVTWGKMTWSWSWRVNATIRHLCVFLSIRICFTKPHISALVVMVKGEPECTCSY